MKPTVSLGRSARVATISYDYRTNSHSYAIVIRRQRSINRDLLLLNDPCTDVPYCYRARQTTWARRREYNVGILLLECSVSRCSVQSAVPLAVRKWYAEETRFSKGKKIY